MPHVTLEWCSVQSRCVCVAPDDGTTCGLVFADAPAAPAEFRKAQRLNCEGGIAVLCRRPIDGIGALVSCHAPGRTSWTAGRRHRFAHQFQ